MWWLIIPLAIVPSLFLTQVFLRHSQTHARPEPVQRQTLYLVLFFLAAFSILNSCAIFFFAIEKNMSTWIFAQLLSISSAYCYFHLINMAHTARRINLLLNQGQATQSYSLRTVVDKRLERLQDMGWIYADANRFRSKRNWFYFVARALLLWRQILFPKK